MRFPGFILCCFLCNTFAVDTTLKYVQVLFRHGDRTPKETYPTDPHQADTWPEGWEQLTPRGMKQLYDFGKYVRHRYVDTGFLKPNYTDNDIYVLSTYYDRTIMSASSMLAGLYPPSGHQIWNPAIPWQPIPVHPIPKAGDYLLRMKCKTYTKLKHDLYKSDFVKNLTAQYQDLLDIVGKYSGSKMDFEDLLDLVDPVGIEYSNNLTLPSWLMENNTYQRILDFKDLRAQLKFYTLDMAMIKGGPLVGRMMENMEAVQKTNTVKHKIDFYSAHKTNINAVLSTMSMFNGIHIPLTSAVFVELHMSQTNQWTVDWLFLNDTSRDPYLLTVPGCTPHCELSKLIELTKYVIPADPESNCTGIKPTACPTQGNTATPPTGGPTAPSSGFVERNDLDCSAGLMHIHLPLSLFPTHKVTMRDPSCKVPSNGTHLVIDISLNQCGTTVTFTNDSVIFKNDLVATVDGTGATAASIIDYGLNKDDQRVPVSCEFPRQSRVDFGYMPLQRKAHFYEKEYGHLDFEVKHYQTAQFSTLIPHNGMPVGVALNTEVFIDIAVDHKSNKGVGIFVDSCIATPTTSPADPLWYPLIKNGCPMQADVRTFTAPDISDFRFSFLAFKFTHAPLHQTNPSMPASPMVYLHCQVSACPSGNCTTSCHSPTRTRRSADQQNSHLISTGPFYLKSDDHDSSGYSGGIVAGTMSVAVVATLVAMVAMVAWRRSANKLSKYQASSMDATS